jgi:hypothetical protein
MDLWTFYSDHKFAWDLFILLCFPIIYFEMQEPNSIVLNWTFSEHLSWKKRQCLELKESNLDILT